MRKTVVLLIFILAIANMGYADIFTKDNTNPYTIDSAISEDRSGFYYRGGIDYRPTVPIDDPRVGYSIFKRFKRLQRF